MWNAVYKRLWLVILIPLAAAVIAYFLTKEKAGQYKSTAVIEASIFDKDVREPDQYYNDMVGAMKTELITSMVSYRLLLHDLEKDIAFRPPAIQYSNERRDNIRKVLEKKLANFELLSETVPTEATVFQIVHNMDYDIARWIRDGELTIERKPASSEIKVSVTSEDPFLSAFAANALSQEYIRYENSITSPPVANDSVGFYQEEVERLRKNMEAKNSELTEASAKANPATGPADNIRFDRAKANKIAEYEMRITEEEWELTNLRDQLEKVRRPETDEQPRTTAADVATNGKVQAIRNKIDQLSGIYAQSGSKDKKLDSIIHVLRKQLAAETTRLQNAQKNTTASTTSTNKEREMLEGRIARHEQNIASIRKDIRRLKNTTRSAPGQNNNASVIAQLRTEAEQATQEYNNALEQLKLQERRSGVVQTANPVRENHHLVLKEKALPNATTESPYAMWIVVAAFAGALISCLVTIAITKPAPAPYDDIFLRVNYSKRSDRRPLKGARKQETEV